jgi:hypothetical protein
VLPTAPALVMTWSSLRLPLLPERACVQLPMYSLVSFGCYSLWCIGFNLFCFRDCPEASEELMQVLTVSPVSRRVSRAVTSLLASTAVAVCCTVAARRTAVVLCGVSQEIAVALNDLKTRHKFDDSARKRA